jgi:hypothetical protein
LFNIGFSARFDPHGLPDQPLERRGMSRRRPELELGIARRPHLQQPILAAIVELDGGNGLGVAAVQGFRQSQHGGERSHDLPLAARQIAESAVTPFGCRTPMIPGEECHDLDFVRLEPAEVAVANQVIRVLVMVFVADMHTDIVQNRRVLEPFSLAIGETVDSSGLVEERAGQSGDLLSVLGPIATTLCQLDDTAATDVGITVGLGYLLAVPGDVVEEQAFAERQVAQGDGGSFEAPDDGIQQNRAGNG